MTDAPDIVSIAARGLTAPDTLTHDEIQSVCGYVLPRAEMPIGDAARAELTARRDMLKAKADKRRNEAGFAINVAELDAWVAEIDAELAA